MNEDSRTPWNIGFYAFLKTAFVPLMPIHKQMAQEFSNFLETAKTFHSSTIRLKQIKNST